MRRLLAAWLPLFLLLAGCVSAEPQSTQPPVNTEATVDEATGGIEGLVTDDEVMPIPNAQVVIVGLDQKVRTDESGKFAFSNLPPQSYALVAGRLGYFEKQARAEVKVGEVTRVDIVLQRIPIAEPAFQEVMKFSGKLPLSSACVSEHKEPEQLRGYAWERYDIPINETKADGTDIAATATEIELKSVESAATIDIDMYFVAPDGKVIQTGESSGPNEKILYEKLLPPGAYHLYVCNWLGANVEYKVTVTLTYEQGERAAFARQGKLK